MINLESTRWKIRLGEAGDIFRWLSPVSRVHAWLRACVCCCECAIVHMWRPLVLGNLCSAVS